MNVLDLFSGIGGFILGLERAGMRTVAFCEIDPFCRRVLAKHWPDVPCYADVRELNAERLAADGIPVDVICGGFPCQDISVAGAQRGFAGDRSSLWGEIARLTSELRPRYVIVENVTNLLRGERGAWFSRVLGDLAEIGFDADWSCIAAGEVGFPHIRDRIWLVAYPAGQRRDVLDDSAPFGVARQCLPDLFGEGGYRWERETGRHSLERVGWIVKPDIRGSNDGHPVGLDDAARIHALGNAVVPQIPEIIGKAIMRAA